MYNGFNTIGIIEQVEQQYCENSEEFGQRSGRVMRLPLLRDRITLMVGKTLIQLGEKMTSSGKKRIHLSEEPA